MIYIPPSKRARALMRLISAKLAARVGMRPTRGCQLFHPWAGTHFARRTKRSTGQLHRPYACRPSLLRQPRDRRLSFPDTLALGCKACRACLQLCFGTATASMLSVRSCATWAGCSPSGPFGLSNLACPPLGLSNPLSGGRVLVIKTESSSVPAARVCAVRLRVGSKRHVLTRPRIRARVVIKRNATLRFRARGRRAGPRDRSGALSELVTTAPSSTSCRPSRC